METSADREARARAERALARGRWPGQLTRLDELPEVSLMAGSPAERIAAVKALTLSAWAMSGRPIPDYPRARAPGRLIRPDDP